MALNMRISDLSAHNLLRTKALVHVVILLCATLPTIHAQTDVSSLPTAGGAATSIHVSHVIPSSTPPWRELQLPFVDTTLSTIQFVDSARGWVWGRGRNVFRTTDAGKTWSVSQVDTIGSLEKLRFVSRDHGWSASYAPQYDSANLYMSTDGGASWEKKQLPTSGFIRPGAFAFLSETTVMLLRDSLWVSTDGGTTWQGSTTTLANAVGHLEFANQTVGIASGLYQYGGCLPSIWKSYDGGGTWTIPPRAYWDTLFYYQDGLVLDLRMPGPNRLFVGARGMFNCEPPPPPYTEAAAAISLTAGQSWLTFYCCGAFWAPTDLFAGGDALDTNHVWLLRQSGVLLRTADGGNTWALDALPVPLRDFSWVSQNNAWAVGQQGKVYAYDTTIVPVALNDEFTPEAFRLYPNYPNPFNAQTVLQYELHVPGRVEIRLIDVLGRVVGEYTVQHEVSGMYRYTLDASDMSSGFYMASVRLVTTNSVSVERRIKAILIR
jgi:photosystem II stability/assembly factor-like uncharacterized protein